MASAGWGAVGGGAWGGTPNKPYEEEEEAPQQAPPANTAAYGTNVYPGQPAQPDPATTSQRYETAPASTAGFGSSSGAYGSAAAGGQTSSSAGAGGSGMTDAALKRKEAELAAKEQQLRELEAKLSEGVKKKNWPICYPLLYHNIAEEIPERARRIVWEGYVTWWGLLICLIWNWFCSCVMLGENVKQKVPSWFLALLYMLLGIPLSWWLWYKRLYHGARKDSAFVFVWFFVWFAIHSGFCIWATLAIQFSVNQWSFAGFVTAMAAIDVNKFAGTVYFIGAAAWGLLATWSCWVLVDVFMFFRGKGGIKQAKEDAKKEAALAAFRQGAVNQV